VLVDDTSENTLVAENFTVSNGTVSSVTMVDSTHYTLEVISDGNSPLSAVSVDVSMPDAPVEIEVQPLTPPVLVVAEGGEDEGAQVQDPADFMLLELGGVTYVIDTSTNSQADAGAQDDYAFTQLLSTPLVAGSWTEVVAGTEPVVEPTEPAEPANPLTDTSSPPMINNEVLDDPRLLDNGSWTP
jgi:hypothetical protein